MVGRRAVVLGVVLFANNLTEMLSYNVMTHRYRLYS